MTHRLDWLPQDLHNTQAINPLAGCAAPLLTIAYQLTEQTEPLDDTHALIQILLEECKHFYQKAHQMGYCAQHILATRYWLCSTLDELILGLPNPTKQQYPSLLKLLNHSTQCLFFAILDQQQQAPQPSADTLEIAYLCLCLGYNSSHHQGLNTTLENRQAQLLSQTQAIRKTSQKTPQPPSKKITRFVIAVMIAITAVSLFFIYTDFQITFKPLNQALSEISQPILPTNP